MSGQSGVPEGRKSQAGPSSPPERGKPGVNPPTSGESGPPIRVAEPRPSRPGTGPIGAIEAIPRVTYYRKAFINSVYPLTVRLSEPRGNQHGSLLSGWQVEIKASIPGALVWPEKQVLHGQERTARFWVVPVARGRLPDAQVQLSSGNNQQQIVLPMRAKKGRGWLFRLCVWLTILLPIGFFILRCLPLKYQHLRYTVVDEQGRQLTHHGRFALDAWLTVHYNKAQETASDVRSLQHWLAILLHQVRDYLLYMYDGYELLLQENMPTEPVVFALLLVVTLTVGWLTGPKRRSRRGDPLPISTA